MRAGGLNLEMKAIVMALFVWAMGGCASTSPPPQEAALERGASALEEGRVSEAVRILEPVAARNPSSAVLRVLGEAYLRGGQGGQALDTLTRVSDMGETDGALFRSMGRAAALIGRVEAAIDYFERGTQESDVPVADLWVLGRLYLDVDRPTGAVRVARRAIAIDPMAAEGHALLAQAAILDGKKEDGLVAMTRAIQIAPENPGLHFRMGNIWVSQGQFESGIASYRTALEFDPAHPDAMRALGTSLVVLEKYREGIRILEKARRFAPDNPEIHNSLGVAYTAVGLYDEATKVLLAALEVVPEAEILYVNLSEVRLRQGRARDGLSVLRRGKAAVKGLPRSGTRLEEARRRLVIFDGIVNARCANGTDVKRNREAIILTLVQTGDFEMDEVVGVVEEIRWDENLQKSFQRAVAACP